MGKKRKGKINFALASLESGISVVPLTKNRTPTIRFLSEYKLNERHLTKKEAIKFFGQSMCESVGWITGGISNLTLFDFDTKNDNQEPDVHERFLEIAPQELLDKTMQVKTKSGGMHYWVRYSNGERSKKLAMRKLNFEETLERYSARDDIDKNSRQLNLTLEEKYATLIEIVGEKHYGVSYIDPKYTFLKGSLSLDFTEQDFQEFSDLCKRFDANSTHHLEIEEGKEERDAIFKFNKTCDFIKLMSDIGFSVTYEDRDKVYFMRPGDTTSSHSGNFHKEYRRFVCHSSSVDLPTSQPLSPYQVIKKLFFGGDSEKSITFVKNKIKNV